MPSKLKIRMGHIEFEYEGDAQFNTTEIKDLFSHIESLIGMTPAAAFEASAAAAPQAPTAGKADDAALNYSPNTIAARLNVTSGPELLIAAAAYLQIVGGQESFKRQDLLEAMKAAKSYYKNNMSSNLTKALSSAVANGRVNELSNSEFSLSANEQSSLRGRLAAE